MIELTYGNLLDAPTEALVNTVNTVGVMGKGIALQFKLAYPENFKAYEKVCKQKAMIPGKVLVVPINRLGEHPRYIINFPTKRHWKGKARMDDIEQGLVDLARIITELNIKSIAIPPLGCGYGGLDWEEVRPRIESALADLSKVRILLYPPDKAPSVESIKVDTKKPNMTRGRAALIKLIELYAEPGYQLGMLEIQKLAYLLQIAGQPLKLNFSKNQYGPYAENLHHVLQHIEGHYIRGYGDRSQNSAIHLLPGAAEEATVFLRQEAETEDRLNKVAELIEGFETPYGMEMLATLLWIIKEDETARESPEAAITSVQDWNERKKKIFQPEHMRVTWQHLQSLQWI